MKLTPYLCLSLGLCCAVRAQSKMSDDEKAAWQMESAWNKAYLDSDAAKLAELESQAYIDTDGDGFVHTRDDEVGDAKAGSMHFTEMSLHEASVRITGDTAIVAGRLVESGSAAGSPWGEIVESTDTLVKEGGAWHAVATAEIRLGNTADSATFPLWRDGGNWLKRHAQFVDDTKNESGVQLLFVGDSITDFWRVRGKAVWDKYYGALHAANIGISGDRTQHVLWRLDHGEVEGLHPKAIVLMIGTNNTGFERDGLTPRNTPEQAAAGVKAVVGDLRQRLPEAKILLLAVFPRAHLASDPARAQVEAINRIIAGLDDGNRVRYLDIGAKFLTPDGTLEADIMPDFLHPSPKGYEIWAQAIEAPLAQLLGP